MDFYDIEAGPFHTSLNENGRVVIPAEMRRLLGVKAGDPVVLTVSDGVLQIQSYESVMRKVQESVRERIPAERSLADELIASRREEARRESAEFGNAHELVHELAKAARGE